MHEKAGKVIPIVVESIKDTDSNVVNPPVMARSMASV